MRKAKSYETKVRVSILRSAYLVMAWHVVVHVGDVVVLSISFVSAESAKLASKTLICPLRLTHWRYAALSVPSR
jgi:hypothetical protein